MKKSIIVKVTVLSLLTVSPVFAQSAGDIMQKVDDVIWKSYETQAVKMKLSTCRYRVKQENMACTEEPRIVVVENIIKHPVIGKKEARTMASVIEPISDKGTALLIYLYDKTSKDNDNWLYLPALGKVKRVIANTDNEESGSYFGSEFSLENTENPDARKINEFTYKIVGEENYTGRPVWRIEAIPTPEKARKTKYTKLIFWVDKERYFILKENLYNREGKLHKQRISKEVQRVDNVWIARKVILNNQTNHRVSIMQIMAAAHNMDTPNEFFTQRSLSDFAFRERIMAKISKHLK